MSGSPRRIASAKRCELESGARIRLALLATRAATSTKARKRFHSHLIVSAGSASIAGQAFRLYASRAQTRMALPRFLHTGEVQIPMRRLLEDLRARLTGGASYDEFVQVLERFRHEGGTRAAAERALETLRAEGLGGAAKDCVLELLDVVSGFCAPERLIWPTPRLQWWVMEPSYPKIEWCRARVLLDGTWELIDGDLEIHRFLDTEAALSWLREEEYAPFDSTAREELLAAGARAADLRPPHPNDHEPALDLTAVCVSCGARWHDGEHTAGCEECGGGALLRDCAFCGGVCGSAWRRMVLDSNDSREAHWIAECKLR